MTLYVDAAAPTQYFYLNFANQVLQDYVLTITSQYSHQPIVLTATALSTNDRYTKYSVQFPVGFADEHKNGIYDYSLRVGDLEPLTYGLVKLITEPGGTLGTIAYDSGPDAENRVADVYYRPNY